MWLVLQRSYQISWGHIRTSHSGGTVRAEAQVRTEVGGRGKVFQETGAVMRRCWGNWNIGVMPLQSADALGWTTFPDVSFLICFWLGWPPGGFLGDAKEQKPSSSSHIQSLLCTFTSMLRTSSWGNNFSTYLPPESSFNSSGPRARHAVGSVMKERS